MLVGIDAGHCTMGKTGAGPELVEGVYTWSMACQLHKALQALRVYGSPIASQMLRPLPDRPQTLTERGQMSSALDADLVISIHVNRSGPDDTGAMVFHLPGYPEARWVAEAIAGAIPPPLRRQRAVWEATELETPNDDWLERPRAVLVPHLPTCAVLVEVGNMAVPSDLAALQSPAIQSALVSAMIVGANAYRVATEFAAA